MEEDPLPPTPPPPLRLHPTTGHGFTGAALVNLGNTCFLNAILQCLTHTVPLVEKLRCSDHYSSCSRMGKEFCTLCALAQHVDNCLDFSGFKFAPISFVNNLSKISPDFRHGQQEDAHEFLHCLLDKLHECCLNSDPNKPSSFEEDSHIKQVFGGRTRSQVRCCDCGHLTNTNEPLLDLSLEIDDVDTLTDALESFTKVEKIDDPENKFPCGGCKAKVSVEKQFKLLQAPQVAALNFKRFKIDYSGVQKIDKFVEYPLKLDLRPFLSCPQDGVQYNYELYAVVVHRGSPDYGHYYSIIRSTRDVWHLMDDHKVFVCAKELVLDRKAYILFYIKQGSSPWFASLMERQETLKRDLVIGRTSCSNLAKTVEEKNDRSTIRDDSSKPIINEVENDHELSPLRLCNQSGHNELLKDDDKDNLQTPEGHTDAIGIKEEKKSTAAMEDNQDEATLSTSGLSSPGDHLTLGRGEEFSVTLTPCLLRGQWPHLS